MSRRKSRITALQALYAWDISSTEKDFLLEFPWLSDTRRVNMGEDGLTFARMIFCGTLDHCTEIDELIKSHVVNWDFSRLNKVDLAILRLSIYSLLYQKDFLPALIIHEAISMATEYAGEDSARFINGVLGAVNKKLEQT